MARLADVGEQYVKFEELKKDDVQAIADWIVHQPHLPKISELQIIIFLHSCYYKNEATKQCIEHYYTIRTHCPEFFASRNPSNAEVTQSSKIYNITPLPKLTPEGYVLLYGGFQEKFTNYFILENALKFFDMSTLLSIQQGGTRNGHVIVLDLDGMGFSHLLKLGPLTVKKYLFYLQEALPVRLMGIYCVNAVSFVDKIMALVRPFMKKEMYDMIQIFPTGDEKIFKSIPKDCLPIECGGTVGKILDFHNENFKNMLSNADCFIEEEKQIADESKRPGKPKNAGELFGVEGTFKKLDID